MSTIIPAQSAPSPAPLASPAVYRMTVDEFERIAGSLDNDQVELVDTNPGPDGYQAIDVFKPGLDVAVVIEGTHAGSIPVPDLLP